ncbi:4'-phosphopantetheinyl transferase superfamily protein [Glaesserella sp.]|uniref:4'-phosphopantetheinyl transferase family protein n=1 Tax=Glaesserella sp. TaxID=2094731 RepID=UPI00359F561F
MPNPVLDIVFARNDMTLPSSFVDYGKPTKPLDRLSEPLINKWKSRRVAYFLLHQLFKRHQLDLHLLQQIKKTESGRPFVDHPNLDFNISHSGEWVAVILSYAQPKSVVGIDIEHPRKVRRVDALLAYYAGEQERCEIQHPDILPQLTGIDSRFYLTWCLREAVLKSQGVGIIKLSEVRHIPSEQKIVSAHCPQGKLYFYPQLPFYLAYFYAQPQSVLSSTPKLFEWKNGTFQLQHSIPIIYQVN